MSYLPGLRAALIEAAESTAASAEAASAAPAPASRPAAARRAVGWLRNTLFHPSRRTAAVNLGVLVASVALGLTASGVFQRGATLGSVTPAEPTAREGSALPGHSEVLPIRTADPGGGLPWGLRVVRTTRGLTCVDVGRVDYRTIGVLGIDGAFGDDDRFHPLSANYFENLGCDITDATGHGFVNVGLRDVPASGLWGEHPASVGGCEPPSETSSLPAPLRRALQRAHKALPSTLAQCPQGDMREVYFGLLGPRARSVTYLLPNGRQRSERVSPGSGAYLIVLPLTAGAGNPLARGDTGGPEIAAGEITRVSYDDGRVCNVPRASLMGSCPPVGFVAPRRTVPSAARLSSRIDVRTVSAKSYCDQRAGNAIIACEGAPPAGFQRVEPGVATSLLVQVSFISHVAIKSSASYYDEELWFSHSPSCTSGGMGGPTDYDIRAGQRVRFDMLIPANCPGPVHGTIAYIPTTGAANSMPIIGLPGQGRSIPVGRFSFRAP